MRRAILLALALALLGSTDAAAQAFDSLIAAGIYPPAVSGISYVRPDVGIPLIERLATAETEWIGCFYGAFDPVSQMIRIERYFEPEQVEQTPTRAVSEVCPGLAIGRVHPHIPEPGEGNTCIWPLGDIVSFKSATSYQGYPYLVEAIICQNEEGEPVIAFYGWGELAEFERANNLTVPFFFRWQLDDMADLLKQAP